MESWCVSMEILRYTYTCLWSMSIPLHPLKAAISFHFSICWSGMGDSLILQTSQLSNSCRISDTVRFLSRGLT